MTLRTVSGQGADIVAALMTEREAGRGESEPDMVWIDGETFYQLRQIDALEGPFTHRQPARIRRRGDGRLAPLSACMC